MRCLVGDLSSAIRLGEKEKEKGFDEFAEESNEMGFETITTTASIGGHRDRCNLACKVVEMK